MCLNRNLDYRGSSIEKLMIVTQRDERNILDTADAECMFGNSVLPRVQDRNRFQGGIGRERERERGEPNPAFKIFRQL